MRIALAGNPNVGKTVIFNALTGSHQHVANFPGCTVEHKEGKCQFGDKKISVIDLPGIYSLSAYTEDERVSREYLIEQKPDLVINIIDASNLERNLFLTIQLLELGIPLIIVLNMIDVAEAKGYEFNIKKLGEILGIEIVPMVATRGEGILELYDLMFNFNFKAHNYQTGFIRHGVIKNLENKIVTLLKNVKTVAFFKNYSSNWLALKLIEQDKIIMSLIDESYLKSNSNPNLHEILDQIKIAVKNFQMEQQVEDSAVYIANERYQIINDFVKRVMIKQGKSQTNFTAMLDDVLTDKYLGLPIFFASLWLIFQFTFSLSQPFITLIEYFFEFLSQTVEEIIRPPELASVIVGGINGVGAILVFTPVLFLLYFALGWLEDSGYLSRAAFLMDKWMEKIGLHGKAFIPLMLAFGCSVPAIMATRSIREREDRLITISIAPFISCSARIPVYVLFAGIFFPEYFGLVIVFLYILGIFIAALTALILNRIFYRHTESIFILELPEFQKPQMAVVLRQTWLQGSLFLRKAGTIIFIASIFVWFLSNTPFGVEIDQTFLAIIGKALAPLFAPFGWDWQFIAAIILGILAKEIVVATLGVVFKGRSEELIPTLMSPGQALSYLTFILLYFPCIASLAVIKSEVGSKKLTFGIFLMYIAIAYIVSLIIMMLISLIGIS